MRQPWLTPSQKDYERYKLTSKFPREREGEYGPILENHAAYMEDLEEYWKAIEEMESKS